MPSSIWFWQRIVSPHMAELAKALAKRGLDVTYVAEQQMSEDRLAQGWRPPDLECVRLIFAPDADAVERVVQSAASDSLHICQGLRGNGVVSLAQAALARLGLRQWVIMETVEDTGWRGLIRRRAYRRLIAARGKSVSAYLATGVETPGWLMNQGAPPERVFPFSYFLSDMIALPPPPTRSPGPFRILFVGQFVARKRLDLLIKAVANLSGEDVELWVIGSGPLEKDLRHKGFEALGVRLRWIGRVISTEVPKHISNADLLVLPSRHDGFGAVVAEAIMAGCPALCSDRCGAAGIVEASGEGGIFPAGDLDTLTQQLRRLVSEGPLSTNDRRTLREWGSRLGARSGADYLSAIVAFSGGDGERPVPPWSPSEPLA